MAALKQIELVAEMYTGMDAEEQNGPAAETIAGMNVQRKIGQAEVQETGPAAERFV
jgi:hypothetical protein